MLSKLKHRGYIALIAILTIATILTFTACSPASSGGDATGDQSDRTESSSESGAASESASASSGDESESQPSSPPTLNLDDVKDKYSQQQGTLMGYGAFSVQSTLTLSMKIMNISIDMPIQVLELKKGSGSDISYLYSISYDGEGSSIFGDISSQEIYKDGFYYKDNGSALLKQPMSPEKFSEYIKTGSTLSSIDTANGFKQVKAEYIENDCILIVFSEPSDTLLDEFLSSFAGAASLGDIGAADLSSLYVRAIMTQDGLLLSQTVNMELAVSIDQLGTIEMKINMDSSVGVLDNADDMELEINAPENADEYIEVEDFDAYDVLDDAFNSIVSVTHGRYTTDLNIKYSETLTSSGESSYSYEYGNKVDAYFNFDTTAEFTADMNLLEKQTGYEPVDYYASCAYYDGKFYVKDIDGETSSSVSAETAYYSYIYANLSYGYIDIEKLTSLTTSYNAADKSETFTFTLTTEDAYLIILEHAARYNIDLSKIDLTSVDATFKLTLSETNDISTEYVITFNGTYENECDCSCTLTLKCSVIDLSLA